LSDGELRPVSLNRETIDMTSPGELGDFLKWGMKEYPAERYAVVLGGHGAGFAGAVTNSMRSKMMTLEEIQTSLSGLPKKPDLLIFNTCLMAQSEVSESLHSVTSQLVASQSQLRFLGLPLKLWVNDLSDIGSSQEAGRKLVEHSAENPERSPAVASLNLKCWPLLRNELDQLAGQLLESPPDIQRLKSCLSLQESPWPRKHDRPLVDQSDLRNLLGSLLREPELSDSVRTQLEKVSQALDEVVEAHSQPQWGGLSAYLPTRPFEELGPPCQKVGEIYSGLPWAKVTRWDEMIRSLARSRPGQQSQF